MNEVNFIAVLVAAVSTFLLGGLWYSKVLFGLAWQRAAGDACQPGDAHPARVFGLSFVFAVIAALAYALLVPPAASPGMAVTQGLLVGAGVVATSFGVNYQFANRSTALWLIDGGYHAAQFSIYGLILGMWH